MGIGQPVGGEIPQTLAYEISLTRVFLVTVLSYGFYLFYWFYLTWRQYRDHTRNEAYPIWHALTLFVPIYSLFRTHAHMRSFKELMLNIGLPTTISVGWAVVLVAVSWWLDGVSFNLSGRFTDFGEISQETAVAIAVINVISIAVVAGLLLHVQVNLNQYWGNLPNVRLISAKVGAGEVIFSVIGILFWGGTLGSLLSPA